ncbi:MAG TPA: GNAT family N-acetyltransferase [Pseudonocardiaceae bacterium]
MTDETIAVRRWRPDVDLARLVEVSTAADVMFADFGLSLPPDDPTAALRRAEHVLVAGSPAVGFAEIDAVDGRAHLAGLAVHPAHGRRGIGSRLLAAACDLAIETGHGAMTLTTFADVPWNARWYAARGFAELPADTWGLGLRAVWAAERDAGIIVAPRVAMIRTLTVAE